MTDSLDYHLLHVLSEPPKLIPAPDVSGWKVGDILHSENNNILNSTQHFLVLDVDETSRDVLALGFSSKRDGSGHDNTIDLASASPVGERPLNATFQCICVDKFYSAPMIIGEGQSVEDIRIVGHLAEPLIAVVREQLSSICFGTSSGSTSQIDTLFKNAHLLQRFLDKAYFALESSDYRRIREFLGLKPKTDLIVQDDITCDCDDHKATKTESEVFYDPNIMRTWSRIMHCCAVTEADDITPSTLNETIRILGFQPGDIISHPVISAPCYIATLPTELLLAIIENFTQDFDRDSVTNLSRTCKLFHLVVNRQLYSSIALSVKEEKWDEVVRVLPKYGHFTKEIYLEAPIWDSAFMKRVVFNNLRAIGDFCPNLERLDLNYPTRLNLSATEEDLPPKLGEEDTPPAEAEAEPMEIEPASQEEGQSVQQAETNDGEQQMNVDAPNQTEGSTAMDIANDAHDNDGDNSDESEDEEVAPPAPIPGQAENEARIQQEKRICAEIDYIIKHCPHLKNFSMQWTGPQALERFYQKIEKLQAIRLWDRHVRDSHLITLGKKCRDLERFYIDAQDAYSITAEGLMGFLKALHVKEKSKLKRVGVHAPAGLGLRFLPVGNEMLMDDDDDDDDIDEEDIQVEDDDTDEADEDGDDTAPTHPTPPQIVVDLENSPMYKFLNTLSSRHPKLERLALIECQIVDAIIPAFSTFENLQSLDIQRPTTVGLTSAGIKSLVEAFKGKNLRSLDLSRHPKLTEDDVETLTGPDGIKSIRYVRVAHCPKLADKYLVDEWVHPDDFVMDEGTWRPRVGEGRCLLEIGDGWKEPWSEF